MAERINQLPSIQSGKPRKYPWDDWADGSAWRISLGDDFDIPAVKMAAVLRSYAHRCGLRVTARVNGDSVEFQFLLEQVAA